MNLVQSITPANGIAALLTRIPFLAAAFFPQLLAGRARRLPVWLRLACPALLRVPYVLVACSADMFRWGWFALYAALPAAVAVLLSESEVSRISPQAIAISIRARRLLGATLG